jgi:hypothetical protein
MEALGVLAHGSCLPVRFRGAWRLAFAVAEQHIRALSTARADRGRAATPLTTLAATPPHGSFLPVRPVARRATRASPFQSARGMLVGSGHRTIHVETACATRIFLVD